MDIELNWYHRDHHWDHLWDSLQKWNERKGFIQKLISDESIPLSKRCFVLNTLYLYIFITTQKNRWPDSNLVGILRKKKKHFICKQWVSVLKRTVFIWVIIGTAFSCRRNSDLCRRNIQFIHVRCQTVVMSHSNQFKHDRMCYFCFLLLNLPKYWIIFIVYVVYRLPVTDWWMDTP